MHKYILLISRINPTSLPSEKKPPSTTNEVALFAARCFRGSCAKFEGKFPGAHRTIRILVNAEVDRNLKRIKIHYIYGHLVVHNESVISCPLDTHRQFHAQWIEFLIYRYYTGSFHLKILSFTGRRKALVPCLWLLKDCTMVNGQTTWTAPRLDYANVYQECNSVRQGRLHLKPTSNR